LEAIDPEIYETVSVASGEEAIQELEKKR